MPGRVAHQSLQNRAQSLFLIGFFAWLRRMFWRQLQQPSGTAAAFGRTSPSGSYPEPSRVLASDGASTECARTQYVPSNPWQLWLLQGLIASSQREEIKGAKQKKTLARNSPGGGPCHHILLLNGPEVLMEISV